MTKRRNKMNKIINTKTRNHKYWLGSALSLGLSTIGNIATSAINSSQIKDTTEEENMIENQKNFKSAASTEEDLLSEMSSFRKIKTDYKPSDFLQDFQYTGLGSGLGYLLGRGAATEKARITAIELNQKSKEANQRAISELSSKAAMLDKADDMKALAAYAAYGGGINAPKFSMFPSEVTEFNTGGSHEENPYDGIPQGIAPDGLPNLVEEGEVKYDNYIFSDRLMLNKNDKKKYKFLKGKTYADAAKAIKKELGIDERPNDLIAKTDLEEHLNILSTLQEEERAKRGLRGENRMMYAKGGHLFRGDWSQAQIRDVKNITKNMSFKNWFGSDAFKNSSYKDLSRRDAKSLYREAHGKGAGWSTMLQAAPAIGNAIGFISNLFDKPTYEHTKKLTQPERPITPVIYTPTHQDIRLDRFDTNYHANKLAAQAGATRRAIREQTASNPYASTAALLSADASAQSQMGDLYRKAAEYNQGVALQEAQFNEAGRRADAEGLLKAASANATLRDKALTRQAEKDIYATKLNIDADNAWDTANSLNLTGLFDNLGAMGREKKEIGLAALKALDEGNLTEEQLMGYAKIFPDLAKSLGYKEAYGGKLRKKKGYTI